MTPRSGGLVGSASPPRAATATIVRRSSRAERHQGRRMQCGTWRFISDGPTRPVVGNGEGDMKSSRAPLSRISARAARRRPICLYSALARASSRVSRTVRGATPAILSPARPGELSAASDAPDSCFQRPSVARVFSTSGRKAPARPVTAGKSMSPSASHSFHAFVARCARSPGCAGRAAWSRSSCPQLSSTRFDVDASVRARRPQLHRPGGASKPHPVAVTSSGDHGVAHPGAPVPHEFSSCLLRALQPAQVASYPEQETP